MDLRNAITAEKENVDTLFKKWYRIPNYQRPYVWDVDNVIQLLDDITEEMYTKNEYFLGSLVVKYSKELSGNIEHSTYDLLDGQQRITTLFLIYSVIKGMVEEPNLKNACLRKLNQEEDKYSAIPNKVRLVFDIRKNVNEFIEEYVIEKDIVDVKNELEAISLNIDNKFDMSIKNMAENMLVIYNYFEDNNTDLDTFVQYLNLYVSLIYVGSNNFDDAFKLFTVMNSRGIALRNSDILKAQNLSAVSQQDQSYYALKWEDIENYFEDDFDVFLSHIRTLIVKQRAKSTLLKEFEENIYKKELIAKGKETFEFIEKYKKIYEDLFDNNHLSETHSFKLNNILFYMKEGYEADYWVTAVMRYFEKFKYEKFLEFLEKFDAKFSFDWITKVYATRRIDNVNEIIRLIEKSSNPDQILENELLEISSSEKETLASVISSNVYGSRFARYLLLKMDYIYSSQDTLAQKTNFVSIEHILPRKPKVDSNWVRDFDEAQREELTNKLGNLILLSRRKNASLSNRDFNDKKNRYFLKNVNSFTRSTMLMNYNEWTPETLEQVHAETIRLLLETY